MMAAQLAATNTRPLVLPALIAVAGDRAALRFLEFFTVNIRNRNTRAANARAAGAFLRWCEGQGVTFSRCRWPCIAVRANDASYARGPNRRRARQKQSPGQLKE